MKYIFFLVTMLICIKNFGQEITMDSKESRYISLNPTRLDSIIYTKNNILIVLYNPFCSSFKIEKDIVQVARTFKKFDGLEYLFVSDIYDSMSFLKIRDVLSKNDIFYLETKTYSNNQRKARIKFTNQLKLTNPTHKVRGKLFSYYLIINKKLEQSTWELDEIYNHLKD